MKRFVFALCLVGTIGLAGCASDDNLWTPMSGGRTAGEGLVIDAPVAKAPADRSFNSSLRK